MIVTGIRVREVGAVPATVFHDVDISPWHDFGWGNGVRSSPGGNRESWAGLQIEQNTMRQPSRIIIQVGVIGLQQQTVESALVQPCPSWLLTADTDGFTTIEPIEARLWWSGQIHGHSNYHSAPRSDYCSFANGSMG